MGGTAVTDTLTLLVLAVVGGLFKGESGGLFWLWLVIKVVFLRSSDYVFVPAYRTLVFSAAMMIM